MRMTDPQKLGGKAPQEHGGLRGIHRQVLRSQLVLVLFLALMLGTAGTVINLNTENQKRDRNLQNVAEAIAASPALTSRTASGGINRVSMIRYLDTVVSSLRDIDVISVVNAEGYRIYHANHDLIDTAYDGTMPDFETHSGYYTVDETGPSGRQRRAYAEIRDGEGNYIGFVMAIMLMETIRGDTFQMLAVFLGITLLVILMALVLAEELSAGIRRSLLGYEPDAFSAMYRLRDNILETLEEGILAVDRAGLVQFANSAALRMLGREPGAGVSGLAVEDLGDPVLTHIMQQGGRAQNAALGKKDILLDRVPILETGREAGAVAVLRSRAEYTKLMEDLSGTRYLVDSMRANNHDFTNKLHVILGLIQMEMYDEAASYIQNLTLVQRESVSRIMNAVTQPAVAALLIGKLARASELNIRFVLREGCRYSGADLPLPDEMLITVIGNLLDNAFEAMDGSGDYRQLRELVFGIYSRPGAVLITVDDTGCGIPAAQQQQIFQKGWSTKGAGRGMGLHQVRTLVETYGGRITVESQEGVGSSISVSFSKEK